jgi:hypothetical protein
MSVRFSIGGDWHYEELGNVTNEGEPVYRCQCPSSASDPDLRKGYMFLHKSGNMWVAAHCLMSTWDPVRLQHKFCCRGDPRTEGRHSWETRLGQTGSLTKPRKFKTCVRNEHPGFDLVPVARCPRSRSPHRSNVVSQFRDGAESCDDRSCKIGRQRPETSDNSCAQARAGNVSALRKRLAESPAQVDLAAQLCIAAGFGRVDYVRILLEYQVSPDWPSPSVGHGQRPETQRNALHEACLWPEGEPVVALLLKHRANANLTAKLNSKTMNAYQMALHKGHHGAAKTIERVAARTLPHGHVLGNLLMKHQQQNVRPMLSRTETLTSRQQSHKLDDTEAGATANWGGQSHTQ